MSDADPTKSAATYAVAWTVSALVGGAIALAGVTRWLLPAYADYIGGAATAAVLRAAAPGLALLLVGLLVFKLASAIVHYRTLSAAFGAETEARLNTEAIKSDILSVLDDRLADMKQDTRRTRQTVERGSREDAAQEFEFDE